MRLKLELGFNSTIYLAMSNWEIYILLKNLTKIQFKDNINEIYPISRTFPRDLLRVRG